MWSTGTLKYAPSVVLIACTKNRNQKLINATAYPLRYVNMENSPFPYEITPQRLQFVTVLHLLQQCFNSYQSWFFFGHRRLCKTKYIGVASLPFVSVYRNWVHICPFTVCRSVCSVSSWCVKMLHIQQHNVRRGHSEREKENGIASSKKNRCRKSFLTLSDNQFQLRLFIIVVIALNGSRNRNNRHQSEFTCECVES